MKDLKYVKLFIAVLLVFAAGCCMFPDAGALRGLPLIVLLPAAAFFFYRYTLRITAMGAASALLAGLLFGHGSTAAIIYAVLAGAASFLSVITLRLFFTAREEKKKSEKKKLYAFSGTLCVLLLGSYFVFCGTVPGILSSKKTAEKYMAQRYPETAFTEGQTYRSLAANAYVSEYVFTDADVYTAYVSARKDGSAGYDGYADYCKAKMLDAGMAKIRSILTNYYYENEDFALRAAGLDTEDVLSPESAFEDYKDKASYEIAFYGTFRGSEDFLALCREYAGHIPDSVPFESIRFYGLGKSGKIKYTAVLSGDPRTVAEEKFKKSEYSDYSDFSRNTFRLYGAE